MNPLLANYQLGPRLGGGDGAVTRLAVDQRDGKEVVLKTLSLQALPDWKALEFFEREAQVLKNLTHPKIPRLLDYWQDPETATAQLVLEKISGQSLEQKLAQNWRPKEAEVKDLMAQLLQILIPLHALHPPLVHRDIKPSNLMLDDSEQLHLIDFGGVQAALHPAGSATVVGTFGYLPPEQLRGQAVPASDLYSAGVTALCLLYGGEVNWMLNHEMRLIFRPHIQVSSRFANWLARMLEPDLQRRFPSATSALAALQALEDPMQTPQPLHHPPPPHARCRIQRYASRLELQLAPSWAALALASIWGLIWLYELSIMQMFLSQNERGLSGFMITLLSMFPLLMGIVILSGMALAVLGFRSQLIIGHEQFQVQQSLFGVFKWEHQGQTQGFYDLAGHNSHKGQQHFFRQSVLWLRLFPDLQTRYTLGWGIAPAEQTWILDEISDFLDLPETNSPTESDA